MVIYDSCQIYIDSATSLRDRLARIDAVLLSLEAAAARAALGAEFEMYSLDTGQSKVATTYRSLSEIEKAITGFEAIRNRVLAKLNKSRVVRLVSGNNFIGPRNGR